MSSRKSSLSAAAIVLKKIQYSENVQSVATSKSTVHLQNTSSKGVRKGFISVAVRKHFIGRYAPTSKLAWYTEAEHWGILILAHLTVFPYFSFQLLAPLSSSFWQKYQTKSCLRSGSQPIQYICPFQRPVLLMDNGYRVKSFESVLTETGAFPDRGWLPSQFFDQFNNISSLCHFSSKN